MMYSKLAIRSRLAETSFLILLFIVDSAFAQLSNDEKFLDIIDRIWQHDLEEYPLFATRAGEHRYNDQLPKVSLAELHPPLRGA